jgi:hypothetical protein
VAANVVSVHRIEQHETPRVDGYLTDPLPFVALGHLRLLPRPCGRFWAFCRRPRVSVYEAVFGEIGGEIYFVAGDRMQASRAFGEIRKIVEADPELRGLFTFYKHSAEIPSTGTVLRVLSAEAGLQLGLEPSFVVFDEVAVQPNDRLWNAMSLGSARDRNR